MAEEVKYVKYEREVKALRELRVALEKLGAQTESSTGDNEYFRAFLHRDEKGTPRAGVFIVTSGTDFSWSRDGKHSMTDVPGAAREILRVIQEQQ